MQAKLRMPPLRMVSRKVCPAVINDPMPSMRTTTLWAACRVRTRLHYNKPGRQIDLSSPNWFPGYTLKGPATVAHIFKAARPAS